ncbi:hypothetical protein E9840_06445 [Tissierella creatinini]|nr:hypothetical protein E9840_06445 [Tissierella creatinini]TJX67514.1 hypothetical protein E8P77_05100 [Soehngenia saccharolytica]
MKKPLFIILLIVIILGGVLGGAYYIYENTINIDEIYSGVKIDGYDVGGKTLKDALIFISLQKENEDVDKSIRLSYLEKNYNIDIYDLGYTYDFNKAVNEAYNLGREGNPFQRYSTIKELKKGGYNIELKPEYDREMVLKLVDDIEEDLNQEAKDATLEYNGTTFIVTKEKPGLAIKKSELINLLVDSIQDQEDIQIPVDAVEPKVTEKVLSRVNGVIGEFSTSFKGSSSGRIQNIKQASKSVNNLLVLPGEEISFNEKVGPIGPSTGYMEAPVIVNGELTPGVGGGVCQSSTTLYNALLLSDVTIVERHPHSIAASYVPRGTDGAVARGYLDLKFKNDFDFPIYIQSNVAGNRIHFYIFGDKNSKDYTVKIEPELIQTIPYKVKEVFDSSVAPGTRVLQQEGRTGYKVRTFKSIIKDGNVVERKQITYDYYREKDFIYRVGPALPVVPEPTEPTISKPENIGEQIESEENIEVIDLEP